MWLTNRNPGCTTGLFGTGVYLTDDPGKAAGYAEGIMLVCEALLGREDRRPGPVRNLKKPKANHDYVLGQASNRAAHEYVLYENNRVCLRYVVWFAGAGRGQPFGDNRPAAINAMVTDLPGVSRRATEETERRLRLVDLMAESAADAADGSSAAAERVIARQTLESRIENRLGAVNDALSVLEARLRGMDERGQARSSRVYAAVVRAAVASVHVDAIHARARLRGALRGSGVADPNAASTSSSAATAPLSDGREEMIAVLEVAMERLAAIGQAGSGSGDENIEAAAAVEAMMPTLTTRLQRVRDGVFYQAVSEADLASIRKALGPVVNQAGWNGGGHVFSVRFGAWCPVAFV